MAITESQLETWSHQGSIIQSSQTYSTIKRALEAPSVKYASKSYDIFLQGSYANDTNIFSESDVDVVIRLNSIFYYDTTFVPPLEKTTCQAALDALGNADYTWQQFHLDVKDALAKSFGSAVEQGKRATLIKANGSRRKADLLVATQFRRYRRFIPGGIPTLDSGICFFDSNGQRIVNFPIQHSKNCTSKHQATHGWFKPTVRILKNARCKMEEDGILEKGTAPSYFLEGLLYNVPDIKFGTSYEDTVVNCVNYILEAERSKFVCANKELYLFGDSAVTWPVAKCDAFLEGFKTLWNNW